VTPNDSQRDRADSDPEAPSIMKPVIIFVLLAACCGALVSISNLLSDNIISANQIRFEQKQLIDIAGDTSVTITMVDEDVYQLKSGEKLSGFVFKQQTDKGYNGVITLWIGVSRTGEVLGVRVIKHKETPGLGDKIEPAISDWIHTFKGKSLLNLADKDWAVKKDGGVFDQFSGATITPRAVVSAVNAGLERFEIEQTNWSRHEH
jgi:RnfABCDGE-type electron transport complex G subunit